MECRILILSCIMFSVLKYRKNDKYLREIGLMVKLLTIIFLDIIVYYGDGIKADVSMCYLLREFPTFLNYCWYMFIFGYFA